MSLFTYNGLSDFKCISLKDNMKHIYKHTHEQIVILKLMVSKKKLNEEKYE